jgi:hypothetical protein
LAPIMPAAPALLSTAIGCLSTREATWQMARMDWSAVPPAGQGQMKVMGRSGKLVGGGPRGQQQAGGAGAAPRAAGAAAEAMESVIVFLGRWHLSSSRVEAAMFHGGHNRPINLESLHEPVKL